MYTLTFGHCLKLTPWVVVVVVGRLPQEVWYIEELEKVKSSADVWKIGWHVTQTIDFGAVRGGESTMWNRYGGTITGQERNDVNPYGSRQTDSIG